MKRSTDAVSVKDEIEQNESNEHKRLRLSTDAVDSQISLPADGLSEEHCRNIEDEFKESPGDHLLNKDDVSDDETEKSFSPVPSSAPPPDEDYLEASCSFDSVSSTPDCDISLNYTNSNSYNSVSSNSSSFPNECALCLPFENLPQQNSEEAPAAVHKPPSERNSPEHLKCVIENLTTSLLRVKVLQGHSEDVSCVAVDGNIAVSASADTTIKVWDLTEGKETCSFRGHTASVTCVVLVNSEQTRVLSQKLLIEGALRIVISASLDCSLRLWSLPEGQEISSVYTFNGITSLQYLEQECYAVVGTDGGKLELWDLCGMTHLHSVLGHEDSVSDIHFNGSNVCTVSVDGTVKVWMVREHYLHLLYSRKRKEISRNTTVLSPCQWKAVTSSQGILYLGDNSVNMKILDWKAGKLKIQQNQVQSIGTTDALCIYGDILVSSSLDFEKSAGTINVWQLPELKYVCSMSGPVKRIFSLAIAHAEDGVLRIVSAGSQLLVWDYDFSQPSLEKCDNSFYCHILEPLCNEDPCKEHSRSGDVKTSSIACAMKTATERPWQCSVI